MSLSLRRLLGQSATIFAGHIAAAVIALFQSIILARSIGPEGLGAWSVVMAAATFTTSLITFRTFEAASIFLEKYRLDSDCSRVHACLSAALTCEMATRLVGTVGLMLCAHLVAQHFTGYPGAATAILIYATTIVSGTLSSLWTLAARDQEKTVWLALSAPAINATQVVAIVVLWQTDTLDLLALATVMAGISVLRLAIAAIGVRRWLRGLGLGYSQLLSPIQIKASTQLGEFWRLMASGYFSSCVLSAIKSGDVLLLGYLASDAEVGYYSLAKTLSQQLSYFSFVLAKLFFRDIARSLNRGTIREEKRKLIKLTASFGLLAVVGLALAWLILPSLIEFIYGGRYANVVEPLLILAALAGLGTALFWVQPLLLATQQNRTYSTLAVLTSTLFLSMGAYLAQIHGATGLAVTWSVAWTLWYIIATFRVWHAITHWPAPQSAGD